MSEPGNEMPIEELGKLLDFVLKNSYRAKDSDTQVCIDVFIDKSFLDIVHPALQATTCHASLKSPLVVSFVRTWSR